MRIEVIVLADGTIQLPAMSQEDRSRIISISARPLVTPDMRERCRVFMLCCSRSREEAAKRFSAIAHLLHFRLYLETVSTKVAAKAFYKCSSLTSITLPDSLTMIGAGAFSMCSSLTSITLPASLTTIGYGTFYECPSLTSITLPDSVTKIGEWAFGCCSSLTSITLPDSVTTIEMCAFAWCSSLTSITLSDSVTTIGLRAFYGCSSLTSISIPASLAIGNAFQGCPVLPIRRSPATRSEKRERGQGGGDKPAKKKK